MLRSRAFPAAARSARSFVERCAPSMKPGGHSPRLDRTRRSHASTTSRLRLTFVRAARASSVLSSLDGRCTVVVGTSGPSFVNRIYSDSRPPVNVLERIRAPLMLARAAHRAAARWPESPSLSPSAPSDRIRSSRRSSGRIRGGPVLQWRARGCRGPVGATRVGRSRWCRSGRTTSTRSSCCP